VSTPSLSTPAPSTPVASHKKATGSIEDAFKEMATMLKPIITLVQPIFEDALTTIFPKVTENIQKCEGDYKALVGLVKTSGLCDPHDPEAAAPSSPPADPPLSASDAEEAAINKIAKGGDGAEAADGDDDAEEAGDGDAAKTAGQCEDDKAGKANGQSCSYWGGKDCERGVVGLTEQESCRKTCHKCPCKDSEDGKWAKTCAEWAESSEDWAVDQSCNSFTSKDVPNIEEIKIHCPIACKLCDDLEKAFGDDDAEEEGDGDAAKTATSRQR
jgi:hypothetical protein